MISFSNPVYSSSDNSMIDVLAVMTEGATPIPITLSLNDPLTIDNYNTVLAAGNIAPYVAPVVTITQQAADAFAAGVTISITGTITLPPTVFPCDPNTTNKIGTVLNIYKTTGVFPDGSSTYDMKDMSSPPVWHTFNGEQYAAVVIAISNYVAPLYLIIDGHPGVTTLPNSIIPTLTV